MAGKYLCPYCYKENKMWEVDFRCTNRQCRDGEQEDKQLMAYMGGAVTVLKQKAFRAKKPFMGNMPQYAECPTCHMTTGIRLCPQCHNPLPKTIDKSNDMIISIIGARDSGKSNYIGVLLHDLKTRIFNRFDFSFGMIKESQEEYRERFGQQLYPQEYNKQGAPRIVDRTETGIMGAKVKLSPPIVCELARKRGAKIERYSLSFLDSAGEDFENPDVMATIMPYLAHSKGIIFLLDPMQLQTVRGSVDEDVVKHSANEPLGGVTEHGDIISNVAELIRTNKKSKGDAAIDIPVVVAFSKFDALKGIVDSSSKLWQDSPHVSYGAFDELDLKQVNDEMVGLLHIWGAAAFVEKVRTEFSKVIFLPCSALGACPDDSNSVAPPKSLRLEDGLLWILKELNKISVKK